MYKKWKFSKEQDENHGGKIRPNERWRCLFVIRREQCNVIKSKGFTYMFKLVYHTWDRTGRIKIVVLLKLWTVTVSHIVLK